MLSKFLSSSDDKILQCVDTVDSFWVSIRGMISKFPMLCTAPEKKAQVRYLTHSTVIRHEDVIRNKLSTMIRGGVSHEIKVCEAVCSGATPYAVVG